MSEAISKAAYVKRLREHEQKELNLGNIHAASGYTHAIQEAESGTFDISADTDTIDDLDYVNRLLRAKNRRLEKELAEKEAEVERLTKIVQTPAITKDDWELQQTKLNQALKALENVKKACQDGEAYTAEAKAYYIAHQAIRQIRGEAKK